MENENISDVCPKCNDSGRIMKADRSVTICFLCLQNGKFDVHSTNLKDTKLRL